jgi:hypothetical protein
MNRKLFSLLLAAASVTPLSPCLASELSQQQVTLINANVVTARGIDDPVAVIAAGSPAAAAGVLVDSFNRTGDALKLLIADLKNVLPGQGAAISAQVDAAKAIASVAAAGQPSQLAQLQLAIHQVGDSVNQLAAALPKFLSKDQVAAINGLVTNAEGTAGFPPSNDPAFFQAVKVGIDLLGNAIVAMAQDLQH